MDVPFSKIFTPESVSPVSLSVTLPTIFPVSPANKREKQRNKAKYNFIFIV